MTSRNRSPAVPNGERLSASNGDSFRLESLAYFTLEIAWC